MKHMVLIFFLITQACAHSESPASRQPATAKPERVVACQPSDDPMSCLRDNCEAAGAFFNISQNRCECPVGQVLVTAGKFGCEDIEITKNIGGRDVGGFLTGKTSKRDYQMYVNGPNHSVVRKFFSMAAGFLGLMPLWDHASQSIEIYGSSEAMRQINVTPKNIRKASSPARNVINFIKQPSLNLEVNANGAIYDAVAGWPFTRALVLPSNKAIETGNADLNHLAEQSVGRAQKSVDGETVFSYTDDGCIDQCVGRTELFSNSQFYAYRTRYFYSGVLVQDQISIFDSKTQTTSLVLFLLNGQVTNFILNDGSTANLHGNEGNLSESFVGTFENYPDAQTIKPFVLDAKETPVAIFETFQNSYLESFVLRGPYTDSHVFGWFRPDDRVPYFKNYQDLPTQFGEEEIELGPIESRHGNFVASLASDGFKHPIIPFAGSDLMAGNFDKFLNNYSGKNFVASLSEMFALSPSACEKSGIGQAIRKTKSQILWILGAGNSGQGLDLNSRSCPQTVSAENVIRVASMGSDSDALARSSAYGVHTIEIAEVGCPPEQQCAGKDAATSYAAPRLARKVARLMDTYPEATPQEVRFALMATARIPSSWTGLNPMPVISGGYADAEAASKLLKKRAEWPEDKNLTSKPWQNLLNDARENQFSNWYSRKSATMSAAEIYMKRGGLK